MAVQIILGVAGGLGLFIFGMKLMAEGLQKAAGDKLRRILELLTFNRYIAVITGIIITVLVQSSSTTTVMVVGFVNAGLMNLVQAVGTILGANIGTTVTAQIIAFKITELSLPAIALGVVLSFFVRRRFYRHLGQAILGFGLLFLGMSTMSGSLNALKDNPMFIEMFATFGQYRLLGVLAGAFFTALVQSSSASTATIIVLSLEGVLGLDSALALILGTNVGTCITAMLAGIGASITARRAAMAHVIFNIGGALLFLIFLTPFAELVSLTSNEVARQVAWGHTIFNVGNTLLFLPFVNVFVKIIKRIIPGEEEMIETGPKYLDRRMLGTPSLGLGAAEREIGRMADLAAEMVGDAVSLLTKNNIDLIKNVERKEDVVDELEKEIAIYLSDLAQQSITRDQGRQIALFLHAINDIERIGDHAENIAQLCHQKIDDKYPFSEAAVEEVKEMYDKVQAITAKAVTAFRSKNLALAREVLIDDNEIDRLEKRLRQRHIGRINEGRCFPPSGVIYLDILANFERIGDHAVNIAQAVLGDF
ncbi:MAG: Na/Pi cotransporter family protein [Firmicutes bacterium]|nr:Na/Pi cotransporter family protein [Bacillota bacterium]